MDNQAPVRMILEIKEPLLAALAFLSSQSARILSSWRTLLKRYRVCRKYVVLLSRLSVGPQLRDLIFVEPTSLQGRRFARQGKELVRSGVPAECVAIAVALYVESCLPYLLSGQSGRVEWARAFAR